MAAGIKPEEILASMLCPIPCGVIKAPRGSHGKTESKNINIPANKNRDKLILVKRCFFTPI